MAAFFEKKIEIVIRKCPRCGKPYEAPKAYADTSYHMCKECIVRVKIEKEQKREKSIKEKLKR